MIEVYWWFGKGYLDCWICLDFVWNKEIPDPGDWGL